MRRGKQPYTREKQIELFWSRVDKSQGPAACWPWTRRFNSDGYGRAWFGRRDAQAHRVAWALTYGELKGRAQVWHRWCGNRQCCNPAHMSIKEWL